MQARCGPPSLWIVTFQVREAAFVNFRYAGERQLDVVALYSFEELVDAGVQRSDVET
jgi:hypothetical protein